MIVYTSNIVRNIRVCSAGFVGWQAETTDFLGKTLLQWLICRLLSWSERGKSRMDLVRITDCAWSTRLRWYPPSCTTHMFSEQQDCWCVASSGRSLTIYVLASPLHPVSYASTILHNLWCDILCIRFSSRYLSSQSPTSNTTITDLPCV